MKAMAMPASLLDIEFALNVDWQAVYLGILFGLGIIAGHEGAALLLKLVRHVAQKLRK